MYNDIFDTNDMIKLQEALREQNKTITCAESCTGGLIASLLTEISGSSNIFNGSIVTYSNEIKMQELNVNEKNLIDHGAVSIEVVKDMLSGVLKKFNADYAIATSGVAGPNGGTKEKPVGTVAIGAMEAGGTINTDIFHFKGDRKEVQLQAAKTALKMNFEILCKKP